MCNGKLAVDQVKVKSYDLIFMDVMMPVMDGLTVYLLHHFNAPHTLYSTIHYFVEML